MREADDELVLSGNHAAPYGGWRGQHTKRRKPVPEASALAGLHPRVLLVDHIKFPVTTNDLAISATFFNGCSNFHLFIIYIYRLFYPLLNHMGSSPV